MQAMANFQDAQGAQRSWNHEDQELGSLNPPVIFYEIPYAVKLSVLQNYLS